MPEGWIRVPDRVLPAPSSGDLPAPWPLRKMLGPSVILAGLSIGSGELVLWPRLTLEFGFTLFWACWIGVTLQFFLNMEIERWTLLTGESAVVGFVRLHRAFGPIFFVCATVPWIWPGWATGAATLVQWELGGSVTLMAIAGLIACGVVLSVGPVVYKTVEMLQFVLVGVIFVGAGALWIAAVRAEHVAALIEGALAVGTLPEGVNLPLLLGAVAFAGAGGSVNLDQSNYVKDKGYAMGAHVGRITSPFTGREEATSEVGVAVRDTAENRARWKVWWRRTNVEHFFSFYVLALLALAAFCLLAVALLPTGTPPADGFAFLADQADALEARFGAAARYAYIGTGIAVLLSTELALLDAVARVAADCLMVGPLRGRGIDLSRLYLLLVWALIGFGIAVLVGGFDQPLMLLVLSASLNGVVMFLYSALLLVMNARSFAGPLRPSPLRLLMLAAAFAFYGYFSLITVADFATRS
jgi:hypothetical protein